MNGLNVTLPGRNLLFTDAGNVLDASNRTKLGEWHADSAKTAEQNCLLYDLAGTPQPPLRARYRFNDRNQLVVGLDPADGGVTSASTCTFTGSIAIDDLHDMLYLVTDAPQHESGPVIFIYGNLSLDGPHRLRVKLQGGGETAIVSDAAAPLSAGRNSDVGNPGADRLTFHATTLNSYAGSPVVERAVATISLAGRWQLGINELTFAASAEGDLANPDVVLRLQGKSKAVAAGLEFRLHEGDVSALLTIDGKHQFDAATATWSLAIGYSQLGDPKLRLQATAKGHLHYTNGVGNQFTISGTLTFKGSGAGGELSLGIEAAYSFQGGQLSFRASASRTAGKLDYELQLGGTLKVAGGNLVFEVKVDATRTATLTLNYAGSDADFLKNFHVTLVRDATGKVKAGISFSLQVTYINGVAVIK